MRAAKLMLLCGPLLASGCSVISVLDGYTFYQEDVDAGPVDGAVDADMDAGRDAGLDAAVRSDGGPDAGELDAGDVDAGDLDAGDLDAGGFIFPSRDQVCGAPSADARTPCHTDTPARTDEERTATAPETMSDTTFTYLVNVLSIPRATPDPDGDGPLRRRAAGFNLDGIDSRLGATTATASCEEFQEDFEASQDPGHIGVDNALQNLVSTFESIFDIDIDDTLTDALAAGRLLLLIEIRGVNDFDYDSNVSLEFHGGVLPAGASLELGDDGRILPDQTFETVVTFGSPVVGDIFAGRLRTFKEILPIPLDVEDLPFPYYLENAEIRFDITASGLANGSIGGHYTVSSVFDAWVTRAPGMEGTIYGIVSGGADLTPCDGPAECTDREGNAVLDAGVCNWISAAFTFGATTATRIP